MRAVHWKIDFVTLKDEALTISIYEEDYSGEVVTLRGGENPISTDEDDDEDVLTAVRKQTGYIRFIASDEELLKIIPAKMKDRYVTLTNDDDEMLWQGFIKPEEYSGNWVRDNDEVELPIVSPLGVLQSVDFDTSNPSRVEKLGWLFLEALSKSGGDYDDAVWPEDISFEDEERSWYDIEVMRYNFMVKTDAENDDDPDYAKYSGSSYFDILEAIMKPWGWTMMERGRKLYIVSHRVGATYVSGTSEEVELSDMEWRGNDHEQSYIQGKKKVTISADTNQIEQSVIEVSTDAMEKRNSAGNDVENSTTAEMVTYISADNDKHVNHYGYFNCKTGNISTIEKRYFDTAGTEITYELWLDRRNRPLTRPTQCADIEMTDIWESESSSGKINFDFADRITVGYLSQELYSNVPSGVLVLSTEAPLHVAEGCLALNYDARELYVERRQSTGIQIGTKTESIMFDHGRPVFKLEIGGKWWNGSAWTTTESSFSPEMENGSVKNNKTLGMPYNGAMGYVIPITEPLNGVPKLTFMTPDVYNFLVDGKYVYRDSRRWTLSNFKLEYYRKETAVQLKKATNHYYAKLDAGLEGKTIDLRLTSKTEKNGPGYGLMMLGGEYVTELTIGGTERRPENALLSLAKSVYGARKEMLRLTVGDLVQPIDLVSLGGKKYYVVSESVEWIDCERRVMIVER